MPILLTNAEVEALLSPADCVAALDAAYLEQRQGRAGARPRSDLYAPTVHPGAFYRLRTMEGISAGLGVAAIRIGSDVVRWEGDRQNHVPVAPGGLFVGMVLVFDLATSELRLIFPDGALQRLRVGATSAIAARALARPGSAVAAVLGAGNQARGVLRCILSLFQLREVRLYSPTPERRAAFAAEFGPPVRAVADPEAAVGGADMVFCATNSQVPVVHGAWLESGMHVSSIEWCELDQEVFRRADRIVIHSRSGDVQNHLVGVAPEAVAGLHKHDMAPWMRALPALPEVLAGDASGRSAAQDVTCFVNNVGSGLQFAAAGRRLLDLATARSVGRQLPAEWFLQDSPS